MQDIRRDMYTMGLSLGANRATAKCYGTSAQYAAACEATARAERIALTFGNDAVRALHLASRRGFRRMLDLYTA